MDTTIGNDLACPLPAAMAWVSRRLAPATVAGMRELRRQDIAAGNLVAVTVIDADEQATLRCADGQHLQLKAGKSFVAALAAPYAPLARCGELPDLPEQALALLSPEGLVGLASTSGPLAAPSAQLHIDGICVDLAGKPVNLDDHALEVPDGASRPELLIAVVGSARRAGITEVLRSVVRHLVDAGVDVGVARPTGQPNAALCHKLVRDGASRVFDVSDFGLNTEPQHALQAASAHLAPTRVGVVHLAGSLACAQVRKLLADTQGLDGIVLAAPNALSAQAGSHWLAQHGHTVIGTTGAILNAPLAAREAHALTRKLVLGADELIGEVLDQLMPASQPARLAPTILSVT